MSLDPDHILNLLDHFIRLCARKVDLIDDRHNIQIMV